jgi:hypothetical protein
MADEKIDDLVKSRHSRAGGNPGYSNLLKKLHSRFHGNDWSVHFQTFYAAIKIGKDEVMELRWGI